MNSNTNTNAWNAINNTTPATTNTTTGMTDPNANTSYELTPTPLAGPASHSSSSTAPISTTASDPATPYPSEFIISTPSDNDGGFPPLGHLYQSTQDTFFPMPSTDDTFLGIDYPHIDFNRTTTYEFCDASLQQADFNAYAYQQGEIFPTPQAMSPAESSSHYAEQAPLSRPHQYSLQQQMEQQMPPFSLPPSAPQTQPLRCPTPPAETSTLPIGAPSVPAPALTLRFGELGPDEQYFVAPGAPEMTAPSTEHQPEFDGGEVGGFGHEPAHDLPTLASSPRAHRRAIRNGTNRNYTKTESGGAICGICNAHIAHAKDMTRHMNLHKSAEAKAEA